MACSCLSQGQGPWPQSSCWPQPSSFGSLPRCWKSRSPTHFPGLLFLLSRTLPGGSHPVLLCRSPPTPSCQQGGSTIVLWPHLSSRCRVLCLDRLATHCVTCLPAASFPSSMLFLGEPLQVWIVPLFSQGLAVWVVFTLVSIRAFSGSVHRVARVSQGGRVPAHRSHGFCRLLEHRGQCSVSGPPSCF